MGFKLLLFSRSCWDVDINNRPSFGIIALNYRQLLGFILLSQNITPPAKVMLLSDVFHSILFRIFNLPALRRVYHLLTWVTVLGPMS